MAKIERILERNEKKLEITRFLVEEMQEKNEDGTLKEEYVTIKKIPYDVKTKIKFLSMKSFGGKTSKELLKKAKQKGYSIEDLQNLNENNASEVMDFLLDIDFKDIETDSMTDSTLAIEKYILDYGVDKKKHSFTDMEGKEIELNYEILNQLGNDILIKYIIDNIKTFSKGFILGK